MHHGRLLVSAVLFLLPLVHAAGIGQVNGANEALAEETAKYDGNVEDLNDLNVVTKGPGINNDLTTLDAAVVSSTQNGRGTAATNDPGTEQSVVNSITAFSDALATYMEDLGNKANLLTLQRQDIYETLGELLENFNIYADFIEDLVEEGSYKDDVDEETSAASEKIAVAQDAFESLVV